MMANKTELSLPPICINSMDGGIPTAITEKALAKFNSLL